MSTRPTSLARLAIFTPWLLAALPAAAASLADPPEEAPRQLLDEPAHFYVETIVVEGAERISPELVVLESRLTGEASYTETELREAAYRVRRLPFVLDARFALARGSERGKLRLVIEIDEVRRFFYGGDAKLSRFGSDLALEQTFPSDSSARFAPVVGARFFTGDYGVLFLSAHGNGVQAGYTRYRLLGHQASLSVGYERSACCPVTVPPIGLDPTFSSWSSDSGSERATLSLGVPLPARNQSVRLLASYRTADEGRRRPVFDGADGDLFSEVFQLGRVTDQTVELAWISDTTDDPRLPTRGRNLTAALELRELSADVTERSIFSPGGGFSTHPVIPRDTTSRLLRASFSATVNWPIYRRQTVAAGLRVAAGKSRIDHLILSDRVLADQELDVFESSLTVRHALAIWHAPSHKPAAELWWENVAEIGYEDVSPGLGSLDLPLRRVSVTSGLTYRNTWGIVRVGLAFVDVGRIL